MVLTALLTAALLQTAGWTWTLYEGTAAGGRASETQGAETRSPVVLANEIPDTANLKTTLECDPGSGVAKVSLYDISPTAGFAALYSDGDGNAASTPVTQGRAHQSMISVRTDHPVFATFVTTGHLTVVIGSDRNAVVVDPTALPKLRRFADLCSG